MRKFLFRLFQLGFFFFISIIVGLTLIALSTNWTLKIEQKTLGHQTHWGSSWERISEFEIWVNQKSSKPRGLIIGSSTAYRNINPHILDQTTDLNWFNYASSGQPPIISLQLLKHAFSKDKFDYILLDIYEPVTQLDGLESAHDLIYNSTLDWWNKTKLVCSYPQGKLWLRYFYFFIKQLVASKPHIILDPKNGTYLKKGFVCSNQPSISQWNKKQTNKALNRFASLSEIDALCKTNGAKLILNISPSLEHKYILQENFKEYSIISNDEFNNPDWFYDSHHMTCEGANLYSHRLSSKFRAKIK